MRKRILAAICLMAACFGCICMGTLANAATERYQVGYAIRDINPWLDPADHSKGLLSIYLTGNGNDTERTCTGIMDDNDNGVVDEGDGLFTTATAVTDPYGKTILYITIDALQGYSTIAGKINIREEIVKALGSGVISQDQIMINANHSHSAPSINSSADYYNYVVSQISEAAVAAYNDRAEAVMTKGSIDALESTAYMGYNGGNGYHMNAIRHYNVTSEHKTLGAFGFTEEHVAGSSFGSMGTTMKDYKQTSRVNVMESDNTMHILLFEFPGDADKQPVVFVNWRAHSTFNGGGDTKTLVSSDFANSIRANLNKAGYRAAYLQGASGNVSAGGTSGSWAAESGNVDDANVYGRMLAQIALDCIERKMTQELPAGKIRTLQKIYHGQIQEDSAGLQAAAKAVSSMGDVSYPYVYKHTDGKSYILNSKFQVTAILNRAKADANYTNLELNVIRLGDNVAFVTAPGELADRYDLAGSIKNEDNDWLELVDNNTYGTPFVMGYTNDGRGYIPFSLEYVYNTYEYYKITGKGINADKYHGAGSYESNTSRVARGTGEDIIQTYKQMLNDVDELSYVARCEACDKEVEWKPIMGNYTGELKLGSGHYYMCNDLNSRFVLNKGDTLCLDLRGFKVEASARCFTFSSGATLSLFDSVGTGTVISHTGGSNVAGGTTSVVANAVFNIYGGTLRFVPKAVASSVYETGRGAVIACDGTTNMYGGTLIGATLVKSSYWSSSEKSNGCGGTVYVSGTFNAYGGKIISGKAAEGALGDCVYLASTAAKFSLSGDAEVDEIFVYDNSGKQLIVNGKFTGKAAIRFNPDKDTLKLGSDVGDHISGSFAMENLYATSHPEFAIGIVDDQLKLVNIEKAVIVSDASGVRTYDSLDTALAQYSATSSITLLKDIEESVIIKQDTYIDLNGYNITGMVYIVEGSTLYCWDSETDDYSVSDDKYGKLTNVSGNVAGLPVESEFKADGYLMVQEEGAYSFHRVNLQMTKMTLRPESVGIYYSSQFAADQVVARYVKQFGIAMSVKQIPDETNIDTDCVRSWFDGFKSGSNTSGTSTLLTNVMRDIFPDSINQQNANMKIFGKAYIQLEDGTYLFGEGVSRSLRDQVELIDHDWSSLTTVQKQGASAMYGIYADVMDQWKIPNLKAAS